MRFLPTISLLFALQAVAAEHVRMLIRQSPLAGSQYYAAGEQWARLQVGDELTLVREADNRHDRNAIRVEWRGHKLGYVPRAHNPVLAGAIDRGERLVARIVRLSEHPDPWQRVEFEVYLEL